MAVCYTQRNATQRSAAQRNSVWIVHKDRQVGRRLGRVVRELRERHEQQLVASKRVRNRAINRRRRVDENRQSSSGHRSFRFLFVKFTLRTSAQA